VKISSEHTGGEVFGSMDILNQKQKDDLQENNAAKASLVTKI
jgi:hypothetical protein